MKARTVVILVICGVLLLLVGVFAVFFARGGEVVYPFYYYVRTSGYQPFSPDKNVVDEIAKLHFVFDLPDGLKVEFQGIGVSPRTVLFSENEEITVSEYTTDSQITIEGWVDRSFPSKQNFVDIDEETFCKLLSKEIQSRISTGSHFEIHRGKLWGDEPFQLKKHPEKQPR